MSSRSVEPHRSRPLPRMGSAETSRPPVIPTALLVIVVAVFGGACDHGDRDLKVRYQYNPFGLVESATIHRGDSVVAVARHVSIAPVGGPTVTDVGVEEVHFGRGTQDVLYKGRMVFRCKTNQEFCDRISVTPLQGTRPRDLFKRWPYATMGMR